MLHLYSGNLYGDIEKFSIQTCETRVSCPPSVVVEGVDTRPVLSSFKLRTSNFELPCSVGFLRFLANQIYFLSFNELVSTRVH